jgi:hypothetical protein
MRVRVAGKAGRGWLKLTPKTMWEREGERGKGVVEGFSESDLGEGEGVG